MNHPRMTFADAQNHLCFSSAWTYSAGVASRRRRFERILVLVLALLVIHPAFAQSDHANAAATAKPRAVPPVLGPGVAGDPGGQGQLPPEPGEILIKVRKGSSSARALEDARHQQHDLRGAALPEKLAGLLTKHNSQGLKSAFRVAGLKNHKPKSLPAAASPKDKKREDLFSWYRLQVPTNSDLAAIVRDLKQHPDVEAAELNGNLRLAQVVDPPITGIPDATTDPGMTNQWHLTFIRAQQAWVYLKENGRNPGGSRDVIVAVVDSGVDATHEDLVANMWTNGGEIPGNNIDDDNNGFVDDIHGCSVVSDNRSHSGDSSDQYGHGTHVAGIIAETAWNQKGSVGVAFNVQIMSVRAAQYAGTLTFLDISEAILYAIDNGAEVINMSFGGYGRSQILEDALEVALNQAMLVAAAGNNNGPQMYPASLHYVIGVAACGPDGRKAWFSNEGDITAPGESIYSTLPGNSYAKWSGTSMAAPVIAGIGALMRSYYWQRDIWSTRYLMGGLFNAGPDAYIALTVLPKPGVSLLSFWLFDHKTLDPVNDGDGRIDSGEKLHIGIEVKNRSGRADNVFAILRARRQGAMIDDPYVYVDVPMAEFGNIGPWNTADNGFIYNQEGVIVGFNSPFVFTVDPDCPNEHIIPFELLIVYQDGWDPDHPFFESYDRFSFTVQRGKNVPNVISSNLTLTADQYWMVGGPVLVESGATLTIEPGTQIQWGGVSDDPYNPGPQTGYLLVDGTLSAEGTLENPINMFPSYMVSGQTTEITVRPGGMADLAYARVQNPKLSGFRGIDHVRFVWDNYSSNVRAVHIGNSIFHKFRGGGIIRADVGFTRCLFDAGWIMPEAPQFRDCVFLQDNENEKPLQIYIPFGFSQNLTREGPNPDLFVSPVVREDETFVVLPVERGDWRLAETVARYHGGHVASIRSAAEWDFIKTWLDTVPPLAGMTTRLHAGFTDDGHPGQLAWLDGAPLNFTAWLSGEPAVRFFGLSYHAQVYAIDTWAGTRSPGWVATPAAWGWRSGGETHWWHGHLLRLPGTPNLAQLSAPMTNGVMLQYALDNFPGAWRFNALLNKYWDPNLSRWMRIRPASDDTKSYAQMRETFWGTDSTNLLNHAIVDYYDNFTSARIHYGTPPSQGYPSTYPFVENAYLNGISLLTVPQVEAGPATFRIVFNRNMNTNIEPFVTFGPSPPHTDFRVKPRDANFLELTNGWLNHRTWEGQVWITPVTGDGYHLLRISDAVDLADPWLMSGYDVGRFRFRVEVVGVASMALQANGREGGVELTWQQNDYQLLAGYNLYRATSADGPFTKINSTVIPPGKEHFVDTAITPAVPMFYRFTVLSTSFEESEPSNLASAAALDTIPPVLTHVPATAATPGRQLRLEAVATDNVRVTSVTLWYRPTGAPGYSSMPMINTLSNDWSAVLSASIVQPPGLEYYLLASDGFSQVYSGTALVPHSVLVMAQPTLTSVMPNRGPASGGTVVTLAGLQFQPGASVFFGNALSTNVVVLGANQIACVTPPHFPAVVDVRVVNTNQAQAVLLNGFTYETTGTLLSLPSASGDFGTTVEVALSAANLTGLRAADLVVNFDSAVVTAQSVRLGPLAAGWAMSANTAIPGRVTVSLASPSSISGSGVLAFLTFNVVGQPPASTTLTIAPPLLNDGAMTAEVSNGLLTVNGFWTVGGRVSYFRDARPVGQTVLSMLGVGSRSTITDTNGSFTLTNLPTGSYTLTPTKADDTTDITSFDASLVLRAAAGLVNLTPEERIAADVNRNGLVSSMDAAYILERAVGLLELPFPNAGRIWDFLPPARGYASLNTDLTGQDFAAILLGDVSGNWSGSTAEAGLSGLDCVTLALDTGLVRSNRDTSRLLYKTKAGAPLIYSLDLALAYDSTSGSILDVQKSGTAESLLLIANTNQPGSISLGLASATPLGQEGWLVAISISNTAASQLRISRVSINEGAILADIADNPQSFDEDRDGVLDLDEVAVYFTDPQRADSDGDGLNDGHELRAGTNPLDPVSVLRLLASTRQLDGSVTLSWKGVSGRRYQVECANGMTIPAAWAGLGPVLEATADPMRFDVPPDPSGQSRFFRLRLVED